MTGAPVWQAAIAESRLISLDAFQTFDSRNYPTRKP
jgi:hypothetical protein